MVRSAAPVLGLNKAWLAKVVGTLRVSYAIHEAAAPPVL